MSLNFSFRGLMAPVFTPFDEYGNINHSVIPNYAKYLHESKIKGILVNGTTGEGVSLTLEERKDVLETWMAVANTYQLTVMAQIGGTNMKDVSSLAAHAERVEVSAILCLPDLFFKPSSVDELIDYLKIVSNEAPNTPLLYYHIPEMTGVKLDMDELLEKSSSIPTFMGIKFTDSNLEMVASCLKVRQKQHALFLGCDTHFLSALHLGVNSAIATTINIFPHSNARILSFYVSGEFSYATREQEILNRNIREITKHGPWVSSMKKAMNTLTSINVGGVRQPLKNVTANSLDIQESPFEYGQ